VQGDVRQAEARATWHGRWPEATMRPSSAADPTNPIRQKTETAEAVSAGTAGEEPNQIKTVVCPLLFLVLS
jgi:hypothetical protein